MTENVETSEEKVSTDTENNNLEHSSIVSSDTAVLPLKSLNEYLKLRDANELMTEIDWNELKNLVFNYGQSYEINSVIQQYLEQNSITKDHDVYKTNQTFIETAASLSKSAVKAYDSLHNHNDWITQIDDPKQGISVWYRKEENCEIHSIKVKMRCNCSILALIAVMNEWDLFSEVITMVPMETAFISDISPAEKLLWAKVGLWWPFYDRDLICHVRAFGLLLSHNAIVITGRSVESFDNVTLPPIGDKTSRIDIKLGYGMIEPIKLCETDPNIAEYEQKDTIELTAVVNIDFKCYLPQSLINWVTRQLAYYGCQQFRQKAESLNGTAHCQRMKEKPVYDIYRQMLSEWRQMRMEQTEKEKTEQSTAEIEKVSDDVSKLNISNS